jgi:hypothetical protein
MFGHIMPCRVRQFGIIEKFCFQDKSDILPVKTQNEAAERQRQQIEKHLRLYESNQPFREPLPPEKTQAPVK